MRPLLPLRVVHVFLEGPLPSLNADDGCGVFAVYWLDDVPLGERTFAVEELPVGPEELAVLTAEAIAPAVGDRLFETGFQSEPPVRQPAPPIDPPDFATLVLKQAHSR